MVKYLKIEYIFLFFTIIWKPFQFFILGFDGAARSLSLLTVLAFLCCFRRQRFRKEMVSKPLVWWGIWVIYAFADTMLLGYHDPEGTAFTFFFNIFRPLMVMYIINYHYPKNRGLLFNTIIAAGYVHMLLIMAFASATDMGRFGVEMNENYVGLSAVILLFFLLLKNQYRELSNLWFTVLSVAPVVQIIMTGSRTAFGCLAILIVFFILTKRTKIALLNVILITMLGMIAYAGYDFVLDNTYLGERLSTTTTQMAGSDIQTGTILDKMGDRGFFYYWGYKLFVEHPIFGVGLGNFRFNNELGLAQHSEYMIQLCELGIIGAVLFLLLYVWIFKRLCLIWKYIPSNRKMTELYIAGFLCLIFLNAWSRSYLHPVYFCYLGAAVAYIKTFNQPNAIREKK